MLSLSDAPIEYAMSEFAAVGLEAGYLVPTTTGLAKGILDAHASLRNYLKANEIHDFDLQAQGPNDKVLLTAHLVHVNHTQSTKVSLYRPLTKKGDPRVWIYGLAGYATPGNLLALLAGTSGELYVINMSNAAIRDSLNASGSPLNEIATGIAETSLRVARELLGKISDISARGYIRSMRMGPTGVGFTLESLLGIEANSRQAPDYKGIELKAQRRAPMRERSNTRVTLFSKTPDWRDSRVQTGRELIRRYGYMSEAGREQLYVTVGAVPNPQGLHFHVSEMNGTVHCRAQRQGALEEVVQWKLQTLEKKLEEKHNSTFWVVADTVTHEGVEYFHYRQVIQTRDPLSANLGPLIADGTVTMDFTLSLKDNGLTRDHGYLFKIWPESRHLLIPGAQASELSARISFSAQT